MHLEGLVFLSGSGVGVRAEAALALRAVGVTKFWEKESAVSGEFWDHDCWFGRPLLLFGDGFCIFKGSC